jgi:hypothetical protein
MRLAPWYVALVPAVAFYAGVVALVWVGR